MFYTFQCIPDNCTMNLAILNKCKKHSHTFSLTYQPANEVIIYHKMFQILVFL